MCFCYLLEAIILLQADKVNRSSGSFIVLDFTSHENLKLVLQLAIWASLRYFESLTVFVASFCVTAAESGKELFIVQCC